MKREVCPRSRGRVVVEDEVRNRSGRSITRSLRCSSCGGFLLMRAEGASPEPARSGTPPGALVWFVALLVALWVVLRLLPYADRARVYRVVAAAFELFLHPATLVVLVALFVALAVAHRRLRPVRLAPAADLTQDIHLRDEPPGHLSVVFSSGRGGLERDFVFDRRLDEEERILAGFDALAGRVSSFAPDAADRAGRATHEEIAETRREIRSLGLAMSESLLGGSPEVAERLLDLPGDHLLVRITPDLARIPWELLVLGEGKRFLWQAFHVARQIRDEEASPTAGPGVGGSLRLLVLADLEAGVSGRALPAAEREAQELLELSSRAPDLLRVVRKMPRSADELRTLIAQGFDAVHFAGHAERGTSGEAGWVLAGGDVVSLGELFEGLPPPLLVFANACGSGGRAVRAAEGMGGAARLVLRQGVGAYLGTLWELHDAGSAAFASSFYRALARGSTLGAAVTAARSASLGTHAFTWANYVLYGDPALRALAPSA